MQKKNSRLTFKKSKLRTRRFGELLRNGVNSFQPEQESMCNSKQIKLANGGKLLFKTKLKTYKRNKDNCLIKLVQEINDDIT